MDNLVTASEKLQVFQTSFKDFTAYQPFIIIAAAVCIGLATREMISTIMNHSILPIIDFIIKHGLIYNIYTKLMSEIKQGTFFYLLLKLVLNKLAYVLWLIIVWFITIYITFIIFTKLIKLDLVSDKLAILDTTTKYIVDQEKPSYQLQQSSPNVAGQILSAQGFTH
jgi:hypothetical protein